jgi:lysophospholipase L1-like esterase
VTAVDVFTTRTAGAVVVLGDSITDGATSTVGANRNWPDDLAMRMLDSGLRMGVLNAGISGNRILLDEATGFDPGALNRLSRDALDATGARTLVVQLGIDDILRAPRQTEPAFVIDGLRVIAHRAHQSGLRVVGATLPPVKGHAGYSAAVEAVRQKINQKIRAGVIFDDVVDFDKVLRDPHHPARLLPAYDSGDHLNPNDAGYQAMADAVPLGLVKAYADPGAVRNA